MTLEQIIERTLYASRWIAAPLYLGLLVALALLGVVFFWKLAVLVPKILGGISAGVAGLETTVMLGVLSLIDLVLIANLMIIVIFSGYENFISKIDASEGDADRPDWMGTIGYSDIKLKIIGSLIAISSIELLKVFVEIARGDAMLAGKAEVIQWLIAIVGTFVLAGLVFSVMDWLKAASKR